MRQTHEVCAEGVAPQFDNPLLRRCPTAALTRVGRKSCHAVARSVGWSASCRRRNARYSSSNRFLSILVLPIHSAGQWYGFIGFDDTQTPRRWTDEDVRLLATAAEMIGAYLARERVQQELRAAKDAAEAASQAKSRFLANISHEIKTPITAVLLIAESLRDSAADRDAQVQQGEKILRNGRHLLGLVDDLLDISQIEAGRFEIELGSALCSTSWPM